MPLFQRSSSTKKGEKSSTRRHKSHTEAQPSPSPYNDHTQYQKDYGSSNPYAQASSYGATMDLPLRPRGGTTSQRERDAMSDRRRSTYYQDDAYEGSSSRDRRQSSYRDRDGAYGDDSYGGYDQAYNVPQGLGTTRSSRRHSLAPTASDYTPSQTPQYGNGYYASTEAALTGEYGRIYDAGPEPFSTDLGSNPVANLNAGLPSFRRGGAYRRESDVYSIDDVPGSHRVSGIDPFHGGEQTNQLPRAYDEPSCLPVPGRRNAVPYVPQPQVQPSRSRSDRYADSRCAYDPTGYRTSSPQYYSYRSSSTRERSTHRTNSKSGHRRN
ncbi:hypothetical protein DL769_006481 [Monosporascus sp. CRB-8-3]|nr:hypothetical protein DL769_006481 [Monosporascus sp. CRB-8-3]